MEHDKATFEQTVNFLHIPKTAGTTIQQVIERTISYYYDVQCTPHLFTYDLIHAHDMDLRDFVESKQDSMVDNCQTRLLAGLETGYEIGFGQCTTGTLETAKKNLREHFAVVGLTEEFDATLILLKKAFGWRQLAYVRQNVSPNRLKKKEIPQATLNAIARVNVLDAELYDYGRTLFKEQVRQQGASFAQEVRDFQVANRRLSLFTRLYWEARKVPVRTMVRKWIQPLHLSPVRA